MIYRGEEKEYYNKIISNSVWMIASKVEDNRWVLLKHGNEENIRECYIKMINAYANAGFQSEIEDMYLLDANDYGKEEINKCINNTNYISNLINIDISWKKEKEKLCL